MIGPIQNQQPVALPMPLNALPVPFGNSGHRDTLSLVISTKRSTCQQICDWFRATWICIRDAFRLCFCGKKMQRIIALENQLRNLNEVSIDARTNLFLAERTFLAAQGPCADARERYLLAIQATYQAPQVGEEYRQLRDALVAAYQRLANRGFGEDIQELSRQYAAAYAACNASVERFLATAMEAYHRQADEIRQVNPEARDRYTQACEAWDAAYLRYTQAFRLDTEAQVRYNLTKTELNNIRG